METKEVLEFITANKDNEELLEGLKGLNLTEVKEVEAKYTDEKVIDYVNKSKSLTDKMYNDSVKRFLTKKLGRAVTDEDLGQDLVTSKDLQEQGNKYTAKLKEMAIYEALGKNAELLAPHVHSENIKVDDALNITGLNEEVENLKKRFPALFEEKTTEAKPHPTGTGYQQETAIKKNPFEGKVWNDQEVLELYGKDRELALKLLKEATNKK